MIAESRENHALLRKQLSHGFSDRSMREQEPIITSYVDLLVQRLREHCVEEVYSDEKVTTKAKALDLRTWYNWTTFDIIGDLAFGEPFGCLREINYHPWVKTIANTIQSGAIFQAVKYLGLDWILLPVLKLVMRSRKEHQQMMTAMLKRRMQVKGERHDLIEGLLKKKDDWVSDHPIPHPILPLWSPHGSARRALDHTLLCSVYETCSLFVRSSPSLTHAACSRISTSYGCVSTRAFSSSPAPKLQRLFSPGPRSFS